VARAAKAPRLPENLAALDLSKQQRQICSMILEQHLDSVEIARRLKITPKTVRNQVGRIWEKAKNSAHKSVNSPPVRVNHAQNAPITETLAANFSTQVQKIAYLNHLGFRNRQIAEILGIKDSNVRQVLSRSKRQKVSRKFTEPVPIGAEARLRNPIEEAVLQDGARMFYNKFVSGTNKAPTREVLRGLHLTGQGGREGARIVLSDRARVMRLLAELSHCKDAKGQIVRVNEEDKIVRHVCGGILSAHFTQILPGHYKPKDGIAMALLQNTLQASISREAETVR
jgi:DNA-binding CsgD family transcriptional regulator